MAGMHDKDIYKRPYIRPNENWVCGLAAEGRPCPKGPSRGGKCNHGFECAPARVGDRWVCTRPDQYGGPCDDPTQASPDFGPHVVNGVGVCCRRVHCTPRRSLRALRGRVSVVICAAFAGVVLFVAGSPWRDQLFSPGPLTAAHQGASMGALEEMEHAASHAAARTRESGAEGCHICHAKAEGGLASLVQAAFGGGVGAPQSQQCLECHTEDLGETALFAHALPPDGLASHTEDASAEPFKARRSLSLALASLSPGVKTGAGGEMACAACHREHHGAEFDLKFLDNQQCQTCHVKQFDHFAGGHPEFSTVASAKGYDYPYRRRTRIIYDHASHERDYFQREEIRAHAPGDCRSCHDIAPGASVTSLRPYEEMCAACHNSNIVAGRSSWIPVFAFPSIEFDAYDIVEEETGMTGIPRTADKPVSPFMLLLLSALHADDPGAMERFGQDLALLDEFNGDLSGIVFDEDPAVAGRLFTGVQTVYGGAMDRDSGGLRETARALLAKVEGGMPDASRFDAMFGFPKPGATVADIADDAARKDIVEMGGWLALESGYRADPGAWNVLLSGLPEFAALDEDAADAPAPAFFAGFRDFKAWFEKHITVDGEAWRDAGSGEEIGGDSWRALIDGAAGAGRSGGGDESAEAEEGADAEETAPEADSAEADASDAEPSEPDALATFSAWLRDLSSVKDWMEASIDLSGGRWTLRTPSSLYYRPTGHADPFLTAWLDYAAARYGRNRAAAMIFDELSGRRQGLGVGACMKCHTVDAERDLGGGKAVLVNWKGRPEQREFTKFNHTPHLKLMDCAQCHRAPWIEDSRARLHVALAASAEEEAAAESGAEPEPAADEPAGDTAAAPDTPTAPAMAYLDSFKAEKGGLEIGVNFSNWRHTSGEFAFTSNFEPVAREDCARCHVPGKAGDSCLICHNYHVDHSNRTAGIASLSALIAVPAPEVEDAGVEETVEEETVESAAE